MTKYGYNASGDLVRQYLPDGHDGQWTYNGLHRILTFTNELDHTWEYTYDADGNRLTEEDPLGNVTTYTYTLSGHVADITTPDPDGVGGVSPRSPTSPMTVTVGWKRSPTPTRPRASSRTIAPTGSSR